MKIRTIACCQLVLALFSSLWLPLASAQTNDQSPLGINLRELTYWQTELATVDFFKRASTGSGALWLTQCQGCGWNTNEQAQLDLDSAGWPRSLPTSGPTQYRYVTTVLVMAIDRFPAGRWTVFYDGEGSLSYGFDAVRNPAASVAGRDAFDVATPHAGITLSITATDPNHTGNYLRNIRVIPPGGTCNGDAFSYAADSTVCPATYRPLTATYADQPFHPLFLSDMRPFTALRFIHFVNLITDQTVEWANRQQMTGATYGVNGAPFELALDLANTLNASPWLEIPARASDDYITQFARLAKARLKGTRPIYLEYYNEAWNSAYPYNINGAWIEQQGVARWPTSSQSSFTKRVNWFGLRTKQICAIWKGEFGDQSNRVKCVMGAQAGNSWVANQALSCPLHAAEAGGSACNAAAGIDAVAIAPYFGSYIATPTFQPTVQSWMAMADGGLSKVFEEINTGILPRNPTPGTGAPLSGLSQVLATMTSHKPIATNHGVKLITYEGGNELAATGTDSYQTSLQTLFAAANRDPRMGPVYKTMFDGWKAAGGDLYVAFESTGAYTSSRGNSAYLEYQGQARGTAPKYDAALTFIQNNPCWWSGCALAPTSRFALFVNASTSPNKTSVLRLVNTSAQSAILTATAYDESGARVGAASASLGVIGAKQALTFSSADLERLIGYTPSVGTAKFSMNISAAIAGIELINTTRDIATGALTLSQSLTQDRASSSTATSVSRTAWFVSSSTSANKTNVLRLINTSGQSASLTATAYDESGAQLSAANVALGALAAHGMMSFTSAQLESALAFVPASPTAKYRVVFNANASSLELVNFTRDIASGNLTLVQSQLEDRFGTATATSSRNALIVYPSTNSARNTVLRIVNPNAVGAAITATVYNEAGTVVTSGSLGSIAANQILALTSSQLETLLGYAPGSAGALYRMVIFANLPSFELINDIRVPATGNLYLAQAQGDNRPEAAITLTTRNAYIVHAAGSAGSTTLLQVINTTSQSAALTATAYTDDGNPIAANVALGMLGANQTLSLTSADLERLLSYSATADSTWRVVLSANLANFELINYTKDVASGLLTLAQPQTE
jgi:hypothetical protein